MVGSMTRPDIDLRADAPAVNEPEPVSVQSANAGDARDVARDDRDRAGDQRDSAGDRRDAVSHERDLAADRRDDAGSERDVAGDERDFAGDERDFAGHRRDVAGSERDDAATLLKSLFAACDEVSPEGGVHGAALSDGRTLHTPAVDVARHSAVHRAIGAVFLSGADLSQLGLLLTARISGPIALTAARAGLAWVASRSVPTSLAAAIALRAGLPLLARAAGRGAQRFGA